MGRGPEAAEDLCPLAPIHDIVFVGSIEDDFETVEVEATVDGDRSVATARFVTIGVPVTVRYDLRFEGGAWRIDDLAMPDGALRERIAATLSDTDRCP